MPSIRVIIIEAKHPENLGSIARICHNFGVEELFLVNPICDYLDEAAKRIAVNGLSVLNSAQIVNNVNDAIMDCNSVFCTSDHAMGNVKTDQLSNMSVDWFENINKIGILFGREDIGLKLDELQWCKRLINITTPGTDSVLNVAHAVILTLWQISNISDSTYGKNEGSFSFPLSEKMKISSRFIKVLEKMGKKETVINKKNFLIQKFLQNNDDEESVFLVRDLISMLEYQHEKPENEQKTKEHNICKN